MVHEIKIYNNDEHVVTLPNEAVAKLVAMNNKFSELLCETIRSYIYEVHVQRPSSFNDLMERLLHRTVTKIKTNTGLLLECDYWGLPYQKISPIYKIVNTLYNDISSKVCVDFYSYTFSEDYYVVDGDKHIKIKDYYLDSIQQTEIIEMIRGLLTHDGYICGKMKFVLFDDETENCVKPPLFNNDKYTKLTFAILNIHKISDLKRVLQLATK